MDVPWEAEALGAAGSAAAREVFELPNHPLEIGVALADVGADDLSAYGIAIGEVADTGGTARGVECRFSSRGVPLTPLPLPVLEILGFRETEGSRDEPNQPRLGGADAGPGSGPGSDVDAGVSFLVSTSMSASSAFGSDNSAVGVITELVGSPGNTAEVGSEWGRRVSSATMCSLSFPFRLGLSFREVVVDPNQPRVTVDTCFCGSTTGT